MQLWCLHEQCHIRYNLHMLTLNLTFLSVLMSNFIALQETMWLGHMILINIFLVAKIYHADHRQTKHSGVTCTRGPNQAGNPQI